MDFETYIDGLIGETLVAVKCDDEDLILITETERHAFEAEGDCCASAWVESIDIVGDLPAKITGSRGQYNNRPYNYSGDDTITRRRLGGDTGMPKYPDEALDIGFYVITTDKGYINAELRVSHNGYYGGWLNCLGARPLQ